MLRLSRSNPRKKYESDIKCDCEDPEKSGECMNDMTLRRPGNSKPPNASKLHPPNLTGAPNQVSTVGTAGERSDHPDIKKAHDPHPRTPNVKRTANCGHFHPREVADGRATESFKCG